MGLFSRYHWSSPEAARAYVEGELAVRQMERDMAARERDCARPDAAAIAAFDVAVDAAVRTLRVLPDEAHPHARTVPHATLAAPYPTDPDPWSPWSAWESVVTHFRDLDDLIVRVSRPDGSAVGSAPPDVSADRFTRLLKDAGRADAREYAGETAAWDAAFIAGASYGLQHGSDAARRANPHASDSHSDPLTPFRDQYGAWSAGCAFASTSLALRPDTSLVGSPPDRPVLGVASAYRAALDAAGVEAGRNGCDASSFDVGALPPAQAAVADAATRLAHRAEVTSVLDSPRSTLSTGGREVLPVRTDRAPAELPDLSI